MTRRGFNAPASWNAHDASNASGIYSVGYNAGLLMGGTSTRPPSVTGQDADLVFLGFTGQFFSTTPSGPGIRLASATATTVTTAG